MEFFAFDQEYLERLRSGDFRTEQHFVSYFSQLIQLKLRSRVPAVEVEELGQEVFTRVFAALRSKDGIRQGERLGPYVNSVCNFVLLEHYRSASRTTPLQEEDDQNRELPDPKVDTFGVMVSQQVSAKVRSTLDDLGERDRRLLKAVFLEEQDKDEVCRDFQVDREYLRVLLHRAKQTFKSKFLKQESGQQRGTVAGGATR